MLIASALLGTVAAISNHRFGDKPAPHRSVNLDLPPRERWAALAKEFREPMRLTLDYVHNKSQIAVIQPVVKELKEALKKSGGWSADWVEEMHGLADAGGVDYDVVETANLFFEWDPGCTAIVTQLKNGTILHARNFDFSVLGLPQITVQLSFTKGGKVVYQGNSFIGYIGLITAMRPGAFSISANSRFQGDHGGKVNLLENIKVAKLGGQPIGSFIRGIVGAPNSYVDAIKSLNTTLLIDVAYYAVAGVNPGEGAIVTRGRFGPDDSHGVGNGTWVLNPPQTWYRLETNFDHWGPALDGRRKAATEMIEEIGQGGMSLDQLSRLLDVKPVLAPDTDFTALMCPASDTYSTILRSHDSY